MINLKDYIARDRIAFLEARDKQDALAKLIALSDDPRHVIDFEQFQNAVLDREYIVTTGIGQNVAIPHIKSRWVKDFFITIGVFRDGVEWQSLDEKPVHLAFLIAGPEEHENYLRILAKLTLIIRNKEKRKAIIHAETADAGLQAAGRFLKTHCAAVPRTVLARSRRGFLHRIPEGDRIWQ